MKYIATYKTAYQISPDDFAVVNPTLEITDDTTIKEIKNWFKKNSDNGLLEVKIIEVEQLTTK